MTMTCRQLRRETLPLFQQRTTSLNFGFDYMPYMESWGYVFDALELVRLYIQELTVYFFPRFSRLLALLPALRSVTIETWSYFDDLFVTEQHFAELASWGDAALLN